MPMINPFLEETNEQVNNLFHIENLKKSRCSPAEGVYTSCVRDHVISNKKSKSIMTMSTAIKNYALKLKLDDSKSSFNESTTLDNIITFADIHNKKNSIFENDWTCRFLVTALEQLVKKDHKDLSADDIPALFGVNTDGHPVCSFAPHLKLKVLEKLRNRNELTPERKKEILNSPKPMEDYLNCLGLTPEEFSNRLSDPDEDMDDDHQYRPGFK